MVDKKIVLFGTGKYFINYIETHMVDSNLLFAVDNDSNKIGRKICGIEVRKPSALLGLDKKSFYVIICSAMYQEIQNQLDKMGIFDYQVYRPIPIEEAVVYTLFNNKFILADEYLRNNEQEVQGINKPYKVGYVPGTFDLFHIGHLNLLRNAKKRCEYLIVGVLTDELYMYFKHKQPYIPLVERMAIIEAVCYVDRVVSVDFSNTKKIDAWNRYHFDCHFSGNDHGIDWCTDLEELRGVGANMEFFEYTRANSSSAIKNKVSEQEKETKGVCE